MSFELIETIEVGAGGAASIEFTSIPQDGTDLVLVVSGRSDVGTNQDELVLRFNGDTSTNYSYVGLSGFNSSVNTQALTGETFFEARFNIPGSAATSDTFGNASVYLSNYTSSNAKSISVDAVGENNATQGGQTITAGLWNNSAAMTSILITPDKTSSGNFVQHSSASLYKVTAA